MIGEKLFHLEFHSFQITTAFCWNNSTKFTVNISLKGPVYLYEIVKKSEWFG